MSEQKSLTVSIRGQNYSIVTDENDEIINEAADLIDVSMKRMSSKLSSADDVKKTTFVALQMAVDLIKKQKTLESITNKSNMLISLLKDAENNHQL